MRSAILMVLALCLAPLAACTAPLPTPQNVAEQTVLDEKAAIAAEQAYQAANHLAVILITNGLVDKAAAQAADRKAFAALQAARNAYAAGNSAGYDAAIIQFNLALGELGKLKEKK